MSSNHAPAAPPQDEPRDAHLRSALRYAPDAGLQPPHHLSAQILAAAHREAAASPRHVRTAAAPRRRWWLPLGTGASGALASVLLAGVMGLLWRDGPPSPSLDEAQAPSAAAAPRASPRAPATATRLPAVEAMAPPAASAAATLTAAETAAQAKRPATGSHAVAPALVPAPVFAPAPALVLVPAPAPLPPPMPTPVPAPATESAVSAGAAAKAATDPAPPAPATLPAPAKPQALAPLEPSGQRPPSLPRATTTTDATARLPQAARAAATAPALASAQRWRIDGIDRGWAPAAWLLELQTLDQQRGQTEVAQETSPSSTAPSAATGSAVDGAFNTPLGTSLSQPLGLRRIELQDARGAVQRLWLAERSLLWCPAEPGAACRRSALSLQEARRLRQALDQALNLTAPLQPAASQPGQRDSK